MNESKLTIEFISPDTCKLFFNKNGFLVMELNGEMLGRVKLIKSYPYDFSDEYICVHNLEDDEIGIIKDLKELDGDSCEAAQKELEARYYCPTITSVKRIKEKMGHFYFETVVDGREKTFTVRDLTRNLRMTDGNSLLIFDVDGNRYIIPDCEKIERKSKRLLEPYLY